MKGWIKEPRRKCIKAIEYFFTKEGKYKRKILCELKLIEKPNYEWFKKHSLNNNDKKIYVEK